MCLHKYLEPPNLMIPLEMPFYFGGTTEKVAVQIHTQFMATLEQNISQINANSQASETN